MNLLDRQDMGLASFNIFLLLHKQHNLYGAACFVIQVYNKNINATKLLL